MPELSSLTNPLTPQPSLGSLIVPNFQVPQLQQLHLPPPVVPAYGDIGKAIAAGIEAHQQRQDAAAAREASQVANLQYLQSQGVDTSKLTQAPEPGPLARLANTIGHTLTGTLGEHENDPKPVNPFANLAAPDPSKGAFSVGPGGATYQAFRRDPAQDERTRADTRRINAATDAEEAARREAAAPMQGTVHPFTGEIMGATGAAAPSDPNALPSGPGAANPSALTAPGGNAAPAPAPAGTVNARTTTYFPGEAHSDPDTDAGRTATGGPLVPASPAMAGTVAVDPQKYPYGTIFKRPDGSVYVAADTGGAVKNMTASGGKKDVLDFASPTALPDNENVQVIAPTADYLKLSTAEKEQYHRQAAATYGTTNVAAANPAPDTASPLPALANLSLAPGAGTQLPPLANLALATPAALTPRPLALADTGTPTPAFGLGAFAALDPSPVAPSATLPLAGTPDLRGITVPVGVQDIPVRRALPVDVAAAAPAPAVVASGVPGRGPHGGVLQPNGNEETPYGTILNPDVYGQRTVRRVPLPGGRVQLVDDPSGKFFAPYVKAPVVADAVIDPATGQPIPGLTMVNKQITSRGAPAVTPWSPPRARRWPRTRRRCSTLPAPVRSERLLPPSRRRASRWRFWPPPFLPGAGVPRHPRPRRRWLTLRGAESGRPGGILRPELAGQ